MTIRKLEVGSLWKLKEQRLSSVQQHCESCNKFFCVSDFACQSPQVCPFCVLGYTGQLNRIWKDRLRHVAIRKMHSPRMKHVFRCLV